MPFLLIVVYTYGIVSDHPLMINARLHFQEKRCNFRTKRMAKITMEIIRYSISRKFHVTIFIDNRFHYELTKYIGGSLE